MAHTKRTTSLPGQLSFALEMFSAVPREQEGGGAGALAAEPIQAILPSNPNSFGYALHILQDPTIFKRALVWRFVKWPFSGGVCYVCKLLFDSFL